MRTGREGRGHFRWREQLPLERRARITRRAAFLRWQPIDPSQAHLLNTTGAAALGGDVLLDTLLLSRSSFLLKARSSVSEFAIYWAPQLQNLSYDLNLKDSPLPPWAQACGRNALSAAEARSLVHGALPPPLNLKSSSGERLTTTGGGARGKARGGAGGAKPGGKAKGAGIGGLPRRARQTEAHQTAASL